jgi:pimeloyl-ACP methyl ester carboxylesterase
MQSSSASRPRASSFLGCSPGGFHEVFYTDWGEPAAPRVVVCCHGLTRNGRDFDSLAQRLVSGVDLVPAPASVSPTVALPQRAHVRVVCPDIVGRGRSAWLNDPSHYGYPQYMADMTALLARLGVAQVDWIGTSMGGLIGMFLAALPNSPIRTLIMNDVGPVLAKAALERIADYVGRDERFASLGDLEAHLRRIHAPFGPLTDAQWEHLARHGHRIHADGSYGLAYDPGIAVNVRLAVKDWEFWTSWDRIACPTLILHGAQSDLLSAETALEMTRRNPRAERVTFPGIGHAPALMAADQLEIVAQWLLRQA